MGTCLRMGRDLHVVPTGQPTRRIQEHRLQGATADLWKKRFQRPFLTQITNYGVSLAPFGAEVQSALRARGEGDGFLAFYLRCVGNQSGPARWSCSKAAKKPGMMTSKAAQKMP